jgi:serine/threonine protein kinase/predicted esterase/tetratricopeptide (TPR) repeat protein
MDDASERERRLEELVERSLERARLEGRAAFARVAAEAPEFAAELAARLRVLDELSLLDVAPADREPPRRFGRYRVVRPLGRGGMGTVYLGEDESGARVAIKVASSAAQFDSRARRRFLREAEILRSLSHPRLVPLVDAGCDESDRQGGGPWFAMEYVAGTTLAQVLARVRSAARPRGPLGASAVAHLFPDVDAARSDHLGRDYAGICAALALDVADALAHLHAHGVVHRDVKPSNVLIDELGRARLFDLGLARVDDALDLTRSGDFAGTPYYTAPEQITRRHGAISPRTDVFALGVVLYEALSLVRPFDGEDAQMVMASVLSDVEEPLDRRFRGVPGALAAIVERALEKDPAKRHQDGAEFATELRRFLAGEDVASRRRGTASRLLLAARLRPARGIALLLAVAIATGGPLALFLGHRAVVRQRDLAEAEAAAAQRERDTSRRVAGFLEGLLAQEPVAHDDESRAAAARLLELGSRVAESEAAGDEATRALLLETVARAQARLGRPRDAIPSFDRALALAEIAPRRDGAFVAAILAGLAEAHAATGESDVAAALARRCRAEPAASGATRARARLVESRAALRSRDVVAALDQAARALDELDASRGSSSDPPELRAAAHLAIGSARLATNELAMARIALDAALDAARAAEPLPVAILVKTHAVLAELEHRDAQRDAARRSLDEAIALLDGAALDDPIVVIDALSPLAELDWSAVGEAPRHADLAARLAEAAAALDREAALRPSASFRLGRETIAGGERAAARYAEYFQDGVTALQAGHVDVAERRFEQCLALRPSRSICAYNAACARAMAGDVAAALDWLERAVALGFAARDDAASLLRFDPDIAAVRGDARFARLVAEVERSRRAAQTRAEDYALHVPEGLDASRPAPLLVVLHARGETPHDVIAGPWRAIAEALPAILLAPSATVAIPERNGRSWFPDLDAYARRAAVYERGVDFALRALRERIRFDGSRVVLAGAGQGGTVAMQVAARSPGVFRGVILEDASILLDLEDVATRALGAARLKVAFLRDAAREIDLLGEGVDVADHLAAVATGLARAGFQVTSRPPAAARRIAGRDVLERD